MKNDKVKASLYEFIVTNTLSKDLIAEYENNLILFITLIDKYVLGLSKFELDKEIKAAKFATSGSSIRVEVIDTGEGLCKTDSEVYFAVTVGPISASARILIKNPASKYTEYVLLENSQVLSDKSNGLSYVDKKTFVESVVGVSNILSKEYDIIIKKASLKPVDNVVFFGRVKDIKNN